MKAVLRERLPRKLVHVALEIPEISEIWGHDTSFATKLVSCPQIFPRHPKFVYKIDHVQRASKSLFRRHPPRSLDFFPKINIHFGFSNRRPSHH